MKKRNISYEQALIKAQNLCAHQERCISDIRKKLYDWNLPEEHHQKLLQNLQDNKFIEEERYAKFFARDKFKFNKWGRIKIEYALRQKNIPANLICDALSQISETDYEVLLENELLKKKKAIKDQDEYTIKSKLIRFATSKGFESGKVFDKISSIVEMHKNNED